MCADLAEHYSPVCISRQLTLALTAITLATLSMVGQVSAQCVGDCDDNGKVAVNELVLGTNIALNKASLAECTSLDRDGNLRVSVDELVNAVNAALKGCFATEGPTRTRSSTPLPSPTATSTATTTPNAPPQAQCRTVYRTFANSPIALPLPVTDSGDTLHYAADTLPVGAQLDEATGLLSWTPSNDELGPFYLPFTATDTAMPPQAARGEVIFKVSPLDACTVADCDPATGCTADVVPLTSECCTGGTSTRVAEPQIPCPEGRVIFIGANVLDGFGRLQNCDRMRFDVSGGQSAPALRFRVAGRCLNTDTPISISVDLRTQTRTVINNRTSSIILTPRRDGFAYGVAIYPLNVTGFDLESQEANLHIQLTDVDQATANVALRVILTSSLLNDLPDVDDLGPTPPVVQCSN